MQNIATNITLGDNLLTPELLLARWKLASEFKQKVDSQRIERIMRAWIGSFWDKKMPPIRFASNVHELIPENLFVDDPETLQQTVKRLWNASPYSQQYFASDTQRLWNRSIGGMLTRVIISGQRQRRIANRYLTYDVGACANCAVRALKDANLEQVVLWYPMLQLLEAGCWFFTITGDAIIVATLPYNFHLDEQNRLHHESAPALWWLNLRLYYWHGVEVPPDVITAPERLTVKRIDDERNAEVRRVMMERFTPARYIQESGLVPVAEDARFGKLYTTRQRNDELLVMVCVTNSTPEPDGSYKEYWLRVDPRAYGGKTTATVQAAVASTWRDENGDLFFDDYWDYQPTQET